MQKMYTDSSGFTAWDGKIDIFTLRANRKKLANFF